MIEGKQAGDVAEHSPLIVWCADRQLADPVLAALRQRFDLDLCAALPDAGTGLSDAGPDVLLLCLSPGETLHRAMSAGTPPGVALKEWLAQAQDIIALNRRNRRKVRILDIDMARDHPAAFRRWFGLAGDEDPADTLPNEAQDASPARDEVLHLLAQRALQGDMSARLLRGELEAVSLNFADGPDADADDPDAAFLTYQETRRAQDQGALLQIQNCAMQDEADARNKRIQQLEQDLEHAEKETLRAQDQSALLQAQKQAAQEKVDARDTRVQQLEQDLERTQEDARQAHEQGTLLQAQSRAAQDEAEVINKRVQQLEQDLEQVRNERDQAREEIDGLRQQDDILRNENGLMQQEVDVLAQARIQLEQRLEQMRQGVESYQVQVARLLVEQSGLKRRNAQKEQALRQAGEMLRGLELRVEHTTRDLKRTVARQVEKQHQHQQQIRAGEEKIRAAEERVQGIVTSKSYRLTAPLRKIRALVSGGKPV